VRQRRNGRNIVIQHTNKKTTGGKWDNLHRQQKASETKNKKTSKDKKAPQL
jgi:hypothetical protein